MGDYKSTNLGATLVRKVIIQIRGIPLVLNAGTIAMMVIGLR